MFRLMKKDFYTQRKIAYLTPLLLLAYLVAKGKEVSGNNILSENLFFSLSIACIAYLMVIYSNFNTGESERMQNRLLLSLPIERRTVINAKYIMIIVWWVITFITYVFLIEILKYVFQFSLTLSVDVKVTFLSLCLAFLLSSIFYPIHFKYGYRVSSMVGILLFFLVTSGFGKLLTVNSSFTSLVIEHPILTIAILSFVITLISYLISEKIFSKQNF